MSVESALVLLRWGVESRIWMPFSVVGNYVHNVNVPAALWLLAHIVRLYPALIDWSSVRPLLHRLKKQCDVTIQSPGATYRENVRARKTKHDVEELDRIAFEFAEVGDQPGVGLGSGSGGALSGLGSSVGGGASSGREGSNDGRTSRGSATGPSGGLAAALGSGAIGAGVGVDEAAGLFGHEVTASLNSLRLELNLWAKPLRAFEEDD